MGNYCGGFSCGWGFDTARPFPCLNADPPSGESVVLSTGSMKSTGSGQPVSDSSVFQGGDSVAHHRSLHDQPKEVDVRKKSTPLFFFVFFSTS
ncbi:hypothetical protein Q5P01_025214 [Channa striata]|uniref:Uncharacterized protein n=1 Tax=Channa striata TaxID=64152 RepID=A0AA88IWB0_CHASR|nr:hypothetical protein Q5P01_025214 [Channa striata]